MKTAVIILPSYNEKEGLSKIIPEIFSLPIDEKIWDLRVIVVDDESPDGSGELVMDLKKTYPKLHLLTGKKQGLGKAYMRGFDEAIEKHNAFVVFEMDADGQHPADLIPEMLGKIAAGADFVIGSRYIKGGGLPKAWGWWRRLVSVVSNNWVARIGFMHFSIHDWTSGYRAIKTWFIKENIHHLTSKNNYVFQIAILDKAIKKHLNIVEVPLKFGLRERGDSKMNTFQFMWETSLYILQHSSFIRFAIVALIGFGIDFGIAHFLIETFHWQVVRANLLSMELAIIMNFILNNFWSFGHKKIEHKPFKIVTKFATFNFVSLGSIIIQAVGLMTLLTFVGDFVMINLFGIAVRSWIVYKVSIIAIFIIPYSYFMYNKVIWKNKR